MAYDDVPRHPFKRFRGDYGQSADEQQQLNPPDEVEFVNEHRSPQQQIFSLDSNADLRLRFPENRPDETYLVLEAEDPVPHRATATHHLSDASGTETTDHSLSDAGVTVGRYQRAKPRRRSSKKRPRTVDDDSRDDDDTGSERNEVMESREGESAI